MSRLRAAASASLGVCIGLTVVAFALPVPARAGSEGIVSRGYPWSADHLRLDVDADVHFRRGPSWKLTLRGPRRTLDRLVVGNGRIGTKEHACLSLVPLCIGLGTDVERTVQVELTGPALRRVTVNSDGKIDLTGLRQDRLSVRINGGGSVESSGTVDVSRIEVAGSGSMMLRGMHQHRLTARISGSGSIGGTGSTNELTAEISGSGKMSLMHISDRSARISVSGSGDVDVAPTKDASVRVSGSGEVRLHSHPQSLTLHVSGSGGVTEMPPGQSATAAR